MKSDGIDKSRAEKKLIFKTPILKSNLLVLSKCKMPGVKNTQKRTSKKAVAAKRHNDKTVASLFDGDSHYMLGRVEKNFGSGGFQVVVDGGNVTGMPMGKFTKSTMPIETNSYVVLEPSATGRAKVLEIVGVLSRSDAQALYKAKRMSKKVWSIDDEEKEDDYFDYGDDDDVGADGDSKEDKKGKTKDVKEDDSDYDVDVDAI